MTPTSLKARQLNVLMQKVSACQLCCSQSSGIEKSQLLTNLINRYPTGPRYGEIPSMYTDWTSRLDAKIAIVLQDWGSVNAALYLRKHYEDLIKHQGISRDAAWREIVQNRPEPSPTHKRIIKYLRESAQREGMELPDNFCDGIYFTNAVLCFQRGNYSGSKDINLPRSIKNCCERQKFLARQLEIVQPRVVVSLGLWALKGLGISVGLESFISDVRANSSYGYQEIEYEGFALNLVPLLHPTAHPKPGQRDLHEQQIESYRSIWKALSHILNLKGKKLITACFTVSAQRDITQ